MTELATRDVADVIEAVVAQGDLAKLTPEQRVAYYRRTCESLGLNEYTKPFDYILLNSKLTLYPTKNCTDQLRQLHGVSITKLERSTVGDIHLVTAYATDQHGRSDSSTGAVSIKGLGGDSLANAYMKCETKAKRRVTLSLCGLGWVDESELDTIPTARAVQVDTETGEIIEHDRFVPLHDRDPGDRPRDRRGKLLERYGALLTRARHAGVVQDATPWVLAPDSSEEDITARGLELQARINALSAPATSERSEAEPGLTNPAMP